MKKTLNVGAGERTYDFYPTKNYECTNVDARQLEGIDEVCDVTKLPFEDETFEYILASDIIEHFPVVKTLDVLAEWTRVLKPGGMIEFRLPNLAVIAKQYFSGGGNAKHVSWLLYGGQEYEGNFHYVCFDRKFFKQVCTAAGLMEVTYDEDGFNMVVRYKKND